MGNNLFIQNSEKILQKTSTIGDDCYQADGASFDGVSCLISITRSGCSIVDVGGTLMYKTPLEVQLEIWSMAMIGGRTNFLLKCLEIVPCSSPLSLCDNSRIIVCPTVFNLISSGL